MASKTENTSIAISMAIKVFSNINAKRGYVKMAKPIRDINSTFFRPILSLINPNNGIISINTMIAIV